MTLATTSMRNIDRLENLIRGIPIEMMTTG